MNVFGNVNNKQEESTWLSWEHLSVKRTQENVNVSLLHPTPLRTMVQHWGIRICCLLGDPFFHRICQLLSSFLFFNLRFDEQNSEPNNQQHLGSTKLGFKPLVPIPFKHFAKISHFFPLAWTCCHEYISLCMFIANSCDHGTVLYL